MCSGKVAPPAVTVPVLQLTTQSHSAAGAAGENEESWSNGCCAAVTDSLLEVLLWSPELLSVSPPSGAPSTGGSRNVCWQPVEERRRRRYSRVTVKPSAEKPALMEFREGECITPPGGAGTIAGRLFTLALASGRRAGLQPGKSLLHSVSSVRKRRFALSSASQALRPQVSVLFFSPVSALFYLKLKVHDLRV